MSPNIESHIRSEMRKAERAMKSEMARIQRQLDAEAHRQQRQAERQVARDVRNLVRSAERTADAELKAFGRRLQRSVDAENRKLRSRRANLRYTDAERTSLAEARQAVDADVGRDIDAFLCHAWLDRNHVALEFYDALVEEGLEVWFSEMHVRLGDSLPRQIDRGMAACRLGLVLVTPAFLTALEAGGWADAELGALLNTKRVIPVIHEVAFADLSAQSPLLAQNAGLSTANNSFPDLAAKVAASLS